MCMSENNSRKTVFIMCKEHYSYPMFLVARMVRERGYRPVLVFVHNAESLLETHSYQVYKAHFSDIESIEFGTTYRDFVSSAGKHDGDASFQLKKELSELSAENEYWRIRASSQLLSVSDHYRFYFLRESMPEIDRWILAHILRVREIFSSYRPAVIVDIDNSELVRTLFYIVGKAQNCEYRTLESTRLEDLWVINTKLGRRNDESLSQSIEAMRPDEEDFAKYDSYLEEHFLSVADYKKHGVIASQNKPFVQDVLLFLGRSSRLVRKHWKNYKLIGFFQRPRFMAGGLHSILFFCLYLLRRRYLLSKWNKYFGSVEEKDEYFFFPLHLIPESTTSVKVPLFLNELDILHIISRALPSGVKLIVKEHGAMIGERPFAFYRKLSKIPNVKLVRLDQFPSSLDWVLRSLGVITLTGSTGLEAVMLGKPAVMLGDTFFADIRGIERLRDFEQLPDTLARLAQQEKIDNRTSAAKYVKYCRKYGLKWPAHTILAESKRITSHGADISEELRSYLEPYVESMTKDV